jgi:hypothetical protein
LATRGRRLSSGGGPRPQQRQPQRRVPQDLLEVLAKSVRDVEQAVQRGRLSVSVRDTFQAVAMVVREERSELKSRAMSEARRAERMRRIDAIATVLARTAAREPSLLSLLADEVTIDVGAREVMRELLLAAGQQAPAEPIAPEPVPASPQAEKRIVPQSVISRQLTDVFLQPDFSAAPVWTTRTRVLASWELLNPLLKAFEQSSAGAPSCMPLPTVTKTMVVGGRELMPHQSQLIAAAADGHRTFLLADEPGLGKTAQALLAAQAAQAYPLLVVVPNVVKTSWAREAQMWTPTHPVTVVHGDGETVDGFSDIVVVNYEILDRHVGWLGDMGFRGMVVDEAHFIKNKTSQRSRNVLEVASKIRSRTGRPLLMALTGTPLINDIEDFLAIWELLGWISPTEPKAALMDALESIGLTPIEPGFSASARAAVIDLGIVRRRKVDVAADIPARRIADMPVELEGVAGRSIKKAEAVLVARLVKRYGSVLAARDADEVEGIDHALVRSVAEWERKDAKEAGSGENVFTMMRKIGQAKSGLAADFAAQLSRNVGKVVFFAKHVDVMDTAEALFADRNISFSSIRGDQTRTVRQRNIDAFVNDPQVAVAVCSLTAAGVGLNLQVASNVVLAELSWTDAEQTQAIDRVHRIGQDQPVTAWRIIAAQTIDARVAELIGTKAGLAARALDGQDVDVSTADVQVEALVALLTEALEKG